jgi:putative transposase
MPREKRLVVVGTPHHITQRGNNRQAVFRSDADRHFYLKTLKSKCAQHNLHVLGYRFMNNHVHLVATPEHESSMPRALG